MPRKNLREVWEPLNDDHLFLEEVGRRPGRKRSDAVQLGKIERQELSDGINQSVEARNQLREIWQDLFPSKHNAELKRVKSAASELVAASARQTQGKKGTTARMPDRNRYLFVRSLAPLYARAFKVQPTKTGPPHWVHFLGAVMCRLEGEPLSFNAASELWTNALAANFSSSSNIPGVSCSILNTVEIRS
jgi:hypothetical protein